MTDGRKPKTSRIRKARQLSPKKLSATEPSASPGAREDETPSDGGANQEFVDPFQRLIEEKGTRTELRTREFYLRGTNIRAVLLFLNELADSKMINEHVLKPLLINFRLSDEADGANMPSNLLDIIKDRFLTVNDVIKVAVSDVSSHIFHGNAALWIEGADEVLVVNTKNKKSRKFAEPLTEALVRGPRLGFNESLQDNLAILRQQVANPNLSVITKHVGQRTKKELAIVYFAGIVNEDLLQEVERRIDNMIELDDIPESGYIEQLIEENHMTLFPQLQSTERPDRIVAALLEGRVVILLDGTPFALIAPVTFAMLLQSPEDYYERWIPGSLIRLLRYFAAFLTIFLPSIYIAFVSFHQGLIPTTLAISIAATREGVPFPSIIESFVMEIAIEILREAGLRLPKPVGQTVGLVGGLVIGEAAVQAGIVSPIMVIVVSLTAISSFVIPQYAGGISMRVLRFGAMICAGVLGLFGVIFYFLILSIHLVKLKSFGVPYVSPAAPIYLSDWKDFVLRLPQKMMTRRPKMLFTQDEIRLRSPTKRK
jgi:spore germination protein